MRYKTKANADRCFSITAEHLPAISGGTKGADKIFLSTRLSKVQGGPPRVVGGNVVHDTRRLKAVARPGTTNLASTAGLATGGASPLWQR